MKDVEINCIDRKAVVGLDQSQGVFLRNCPTTGGTCCLVIEFLQNFCTKRSRLFVFNNSRALSRMLVSSDSALAA